MKKTLFLTLTLIFVLSMIGSVLGADETRRDFLVYYDDPNWPSGTEEYHDSVNAAQRALIAERYELGIGQDCEAADSVRAMHPGFGWFVYNSFQDNYVAVQAMGEHNWLMARAQADGVDPETFYLHYYDDTRISIQGTTIFIPGWGGGSASTKAEARLPAYYSNKSRIMCNYSVPTARQYYKEYMVEKLKVHPTDNYGVTSTGYYTGIFWDNCQPELYNIGSVVSGGHVLEHPTHARIDSLGQGKLDWWYSANMHPFMQELMDTLRMGDLWMPDGTKIDNMLNTAGNTRSGLAEDDVCTHLFQEFCPGITRQYASYFGTFAAHDVLCTENGVHVCYSPNANTTVSGGAGSYTREQVLHGNLCWFYASCTDSSLLYQQVVNGPSTDRWDSVSWCGSMDYNVGEPLAAYMVAQTGTDPSGYSYTVYKRVFENAVVYVRPRGRWDQDIDEATAATIDLDSPARELRPDGSIGDVVESITIRNAEGKILVPAGGDVTPPDPIDDLQGDIGDTPGTISLSWTATGDDGNEGSATYYTIKYGTGIDLETNWGEGSTYPTPPSPAPSGTPETFVLTGLSKGVLYNIALKAYDENGNGSAVSNAVDVYSGGIMPPGGLYTQVNEAEQWASLTCSTVTSYYESLLYEFSLEDSTLGTETSVYADEVPGATRNVVFTDLDSASTYVWRCRAVAVGQDSSNWSAPKKFRLSNISPDPPVADFPQDQDTVTLAAEMPLVITAANGSDSDGPENLTYDFQLYDGSLSTLIVSAEGVAEGSSTTDWIVPISVEEGNYSWRSRCFDGMDHSFWSDWCSFTVVSFGSGGTTATAVRIIGYPNPVSFAGGESVTFRLPDNPVDLLIQTVSGETVLLKRSISGEWQWDGRNASGAMVSLGVYLWFVRDTGEKGKIVVKP